MMSETDLPLLRFLASLPERIQVLRSRTCTVASRHLADTVMRDWRISGSRINIMPNMVDAAWISGLSGKSEEEGCGKYMLYFGRLERLKGVHVISKALRKVLPAMPDVKMVFIGRDCGFKASILEENADLANRILFFDTMSKERLFG